MVLDDTMVGCSTNDRFGFSVFFFFFSYQPVFFF